MIYLRSFLDRFLKTLVIGSSFLYLAGCLPQGGKEERIKKSRTEAAHDHEEKEKEADANPLKDCEDEASTKTELLITEDEHNEEDHDHEEKAVEAKKSEVKKEDCKKKVTEPKEEEHDHDHE